MLNLIMKAIGINSGDASREDTGLINTGLLSGILLLEAAHSDYHCSREELEHVVDTLKSMYGLRQDHVDELMVLARAERENAVDLHRFTRFANEKMTRQEKVTLLEGIWRIILADGRIDKYEEHYARKISDLLWLDHSDYMDAKKKAGRDQNS